MRSLIYVFCFAFLGLQTALNQILYSQSDWCYLLANVFRDFFSCFNFARASSALKIFVFTCMFKKVNDIVVLVCSLQL